MDENQNGYQQSPYGQQYSQQVNQQSPYGQQYSQPDYSQQVNQQSPYGQQYSQPDYSQQVNQQSPYGQPDSNQQVNQQSPYGQQYGRSDSNQQVNQQMPYGQPGMQPMSGAPAGNSIDPVADEQAKKLSWISLICYLAPIALGIIGTILNTIVQGSSLPSDTYYNVVSGVLGSAGGASRIAAWVLMIVARVKCPQNKFAKVLMWVYIGILIASVLAAIVLIIFLATMCHACTEDCSGMGLQLFLNLF